MHKWSQCKLITTYWYDILTRFCLYLQEN